MGADRGGVAYYNDSKGTNVDATLKALAAFTEPIVLIAGGRDKGQRVRRAGRRRTGPGQGRGLDRRGTRDLGPALRAVTHVEEAESMGEAVRRAAALAAPGDVVLLSPACASFDLFRDYEHRVNVFTEEVLGPPGALAMPRKMSPDYWLFLLVLALLGLGVVMVYSASAILATDRFGDAHFFLKKQLFWAVLGLAVMWGVMAVDYRRWRPLVSPLLALAFVLLVLVLIPPFGQSINGTRRWLRWGPISVQPTELAKLVLVVYLADFLARRQAAHRQPVARGRAAAGRDRRGGRPRPGPT